ncbi:MAG: SpoVA/SpoVAEb family sporulation membrane protein [Coriobacteriales bacterium]|jgi:hypothetical protein
MARRLGWTFIIGGFLGTLAQVIYNIWSTYCTDPSNILSQTTGSDVLVTMGIIGGILGGLGIYRLLGKHSIFGSALPFSGFAFGIGQNMIEPWIRKKNEGREGFWHCTWHGLWMVISFNVFVFAMSFAIAGIYYYGFGIHDSSQFLLVEPLANPVSGLPLYLTAFITAGAICCVWELFISATKLSLTKVLAISWLTGCALTPTGIMGWLSSFGGWGANVMIMNGGQIFYNVSFMFFNGTAGAGFEFASLVVTIGCLFLTGWLCFIVHIAKFGHAPQDSRRPVAATNLEAGLIDEVEFDSVYGTALAPANYTGRAYSDMPFSTDEAYDGQMADPDYSSTSFSNGAILADDNAITSDDRVDHNTHM